MNKTCLAFCNCRVRWRPKAAQYAAVCPRYKPRFTTVEVSTIFKGFSRDAVPTATTNSSNNETPRVAGRNLMPRTLTRKETPMRKHLFLLTVLAVTLAGFCAGWTWDGGIALH